LKKKKGGKKGKRNYKGMMLRTNGEVGLVKREKWEIGRGNQKNREMTALC
jgi:hypothetical protein